MLNYYLYPLPKQIFRVLIHKEEAAILFHMVNYSVGRGQQLLNTDITRVFENAHRMKIDLQLPSHTLKEWELSAESVSRKAAFVHS